MKMAPGAIRVCVLEGIYANMTELGLPLSLAVELQYRGLRLDSSLWTARLSNGGPWWNKFFRVGPKFVPGGGKQFWGVGGSKLNVTATRSPSFGPRSVAALCAIGNKGSQSPATS